jgi:hypothetical protein
MPLSSHDSFGCIVKTPRKIQSDLAQRSFGPFAPQSATTNRMKKLGCWGFRFTLRFSMVLSLLFSELRRRFHASYELTLVVLCLL